MAATSGESKNETLAFKMINKEEPKEIKVTRGVVCIVTNSFKKMRLAAWKLERTGWQKDKERISSTFKSMDYQVNFIENAKKSKILMDLNRIGYKASEIQQVCEPEVFFLFVMSHGGENGIIHTDYIDSENENSKKRTKGTQVSSMLAFESYTTKEVFNALRTNRNLKRCQKIVVIQACRGELTEAFFDSAANQTTLTTRAEVNENSCRFPVVNLPTNTIVLYSCVEGTLANREDKNGSLLVRHLFEELQSARNGKDFLEIITCVLGKISETSISLGSGQTPEVLSNASTRLVLERISKISKRKQSKDVKINSIAIEYHSRDEYHVWDDENYVKGYAALIKFDPLFAENNLVTALDTNLGLDVQVFSTSDNQSKIEDAVTSIFNVSASAAFLIVLVVGKLVSSELGCKEVCLATQSKPTPISEVMRRFVGTSNFNLIGKPKFFFFIDDGKSKKVVLPPKIIPGKDAGPSIRKIYTNHSYNMTFLCVGQEDLRILVEQLSKPDLRRGGCVLQSHLAECVQRCNFGKETLHEIHTSFTSTIPKLVSLPNFKNTYLPPVVSFRQEDISPYRVGLQYWSAVVEAFLPEADPKVKPPRVAWMIVYPPGHGKSRFTYELAKVLEKKIECTEVVRVNLRKYCDYFNDCDVGTAKPTWRHFLKDQNNPPSGKMAFIFDGFEKVAQFYAGIVSTIFLQVFHESHSILVTSRPGGPGIRTNLEELLAKIPLFMPVFLEPFSLGIRKQFLGHQLGLPNEDVTNLLSTLEQLFLCDDFLGNPHHLQIISQFGVDVHESQRFEIVATVMRSLVSKALVKIESVGKNSYMLNTKIKLRQQMLVAAAAQLEGLGYCHVELTPEGIEKINIVGILTILDCENKQFEFSFLTFRCFMLACASLANRNRNLRNENQISLILKDKFEKGSNEIALVGKLVDSFEIMSEKDPIRMSSMLKSLVGAFSF